MSVLRIPLRVSAALRLKLGAIPVIDTAFATLVTKRADGFLISPDALFVTCREQLLALAARHALPAMYHRREFVEAGGLMSYGSNLADQFRQTGVCASRILKGAL
jgi:putative ABC transport system substrate-binding protein